MLGGGAILAIGSYIYFTGLAAEKEKEKEISIGVNITDANGQTISYDPSTLMRKLHKGLTTSYFFDFSERCEPLQQLMNLDNLRFMATVKAYQKAYNNRKKVSFLFSVRHNKENKERTLYVDIKTSTRVANN